MSDWVASVVSCNGRPRVDFRHAPLATEVPWRGNIPRKAKGRRRSTQVRTVAWAAEKGSFDRKPAYDFSRFEFSHLGQAQRAR